MSKTQTEKIVTLYEISVMVTPDYQSAKMTAIKYRATEKFYIAVPDPDRNISRERVRLSQVDSMENLTNWDTRLPFVAAVLWYVTKDPVKALKEAKAAAMATIENNLRLIYEVREKLIAIEV